MLQIQNEPINGRTLQELLDHVLKEAKAKIGIRYTRFGLFDLISLGDTSNPEQKIYALCSQGGEVDCNCRIEIDYKHDVFCAQVSKAWKL